MKFRKKPIIIDAEQWFPGKKMECIQGNPPFIETLEGRLDVKPGDWIITGVKGEHYPCKPDIFEMTYDPLDSLPFTK